MVQRVIRFAYHTAPVRTGRELRPFQMRDGDAALFLTSALMADGYMYAGPIFNYPYEPAEGEIDLRTLDPRDIDPDDLDQSDERFLRETDLILITTRPPMDDFALGNRRCIKRSFTSLEHRLFEGPLRRAFKTCSRSDIVLAPTVTRISPAIAMRQSIVFRQNGGATYQSYGSPITGDVQTFNHAEGDDRLTAAFLIYAKHAWPGGPALLAAFGMGGTDTLGWSYLLATRYRELLCATSFAMVEIRSRAQSKYPSVMDFADAWDVTLLGAEGVTPESSPSRPVLR